MVHSEDATFNFYVKCKSGKISQSIYLRSPDLMCYVGSL